MTFDMRAAKYIFEEHNPGIFIYREKSNFDSTKYDEILLKIAPFVKGKLQPVISDVVDVMENKLSELVGIKAQDLPLVMIHDTQGKLTKSYKMDNTLEITEENILNFYKDWRDSKLERHIKSKEIPTNQTDSTYILVGKTLEENVNNTEKDVVVIFYAPWCKHCKEFMPIFDNLSKKLKNLPNLMMAKFDAHYNEASLISVQYYPTVVMWKADDKSNPIIFSEERNEENLLKFLQIHATHSIHIGENLITSKNNKEKIESKDL